MRPGKDGGNWKWRAALLALALVLLSAAGAAAENSGRAGKVSWLLDDNRQLTISGQGAIPNYWPDRAGQFAAPWGTEAVSIVIQDGVTAIGASAFRGCAALESVTLPPSLVSIGAAAFGGCGALEAVALPDGVTSVAHDAFDGCPAIRRSRLDTETARALSEAGYSFRDADTRFDLICEYTDGSRTGARLTGVNSNETTVVIPPWITTVAEGAFAGCGRLGAIYVNERNEHLLSYSEALYSKDGSVLLACPPAKRSLTFHRNLRVIGSGAFAGCGALRRLELPEGIERIGSLAFGACGGLQELVLPESLVTIGSGAFAACTGLQSLHIPAGVERIGPLAFMYCSRLEEITVSEENGSYAAEGGLLLDKAGQTLLACPGGLEAAVIPQGVTRVESGAFLGCGHLTDVYLIGSPDSFESLVIGARNAPLLGAARHILHPVSLSLQGQLALAQGESVKLDWSVSPPDDAYVFVWESSSPRNVWVTEDGTVTGLRLGSALVTLTVRDEHRQVRAGCEVRVWPADTLSLPEGLAVIGSEAFADMPLVRTIVIPASVSAIADDAFSGTNAVLSVAADSYALTWAQEHKMPYTVRRGD